MNDVAIAGGGLSARILACGATVAELHHQGLDRVLTLAPHTPDGYGAGHIYAGAIVGRFANRIGRGQFTLDGQTHHTDRNFLDRHTLHGGAEGTHALDWQMGEAATDAVTLTLDLPDGHMGFPGRAQLTVTYRLTDDAALEVRLHATVDRPCPVSLAHHSYYNLAGGGDVTGHRLHVAADHYLPVDSQMIPTGRIAPVSGTAFDFREARQIGDAGYDHNFCLSDGPRPLRPVAWLAVDDLAMTVETDQPGLQVYDGAHFAGVPGREGWPLPPKAGLALETQAWPDAPNRPDFPGCILRPGQEYHSVTRYVFSDARG